jgi:hypothetical protein
MSTSGFKTPGRFSNAKFVIDSKNLLSSFQTDTRAAEFPSPNTGYKHFRNTSIISDIENNTTGTIAFWYYPQGTAAIEYFLQVTNGNSASVNGDVNYMLFRRNSNNSLQMFLVNDFVTQWNYTTPIGVISNDNWYHIVLVQDGSAPKIYIDNVDQTLTPSVTTDTTQWFNNLIPQGGAANLDLLIIGAYKTLTSDDGTTQPALQGRLDSYGIWSTNLSPINISDLYNSGSGINHSQLSTALTTNLVSWWSLNENGDDRIDSQGSNDLIPYSGSSIGYYDPLKPNQFSGPGFATGKVSSGDFFYAKNLVNNANFTPQNGVELIGDYWNFDKTDDYIDCDSVVDVLKNNTTGTIETWINMNALGGAESHTIFSLTRSDGIGALFINVFKNTGKFQILGYDSSIKLTVSADTVAVVGEWTHFVWTQPADGNGPRLYINGERDLNTGTPLLTIPDFWFANVTLADTCHVGNLKWNNGSSSAEFNGKISSVKVYDRALSAQEIRNNYNAMKYRF